jgi:hypothetical protein
MPRYDGRNYFIVKHDLASFQALSGVIWNNSNTKREPPTGYRSVEKGDRWLSFAYTSGGANDERVSLVEGFYECTQQFRYGNIISKKALALTNGKRGAWLIEGRPFGTRLDDPVVIPPIGNFLGNKPFSRRTITRISKKEFEGIRKWIRDHRYSPENIPCLKRDPQNEQEVLAIIASKPERFGIEKIIRVQTRFPDMLVKLKGKAEVVHLELELYSKSFLNHGHAEQVRNRRFRGNANSKGDNKPVCVLCWIDDAKSRTVTRHVHRIYVLRDLLKDRKPIRW